jgi:DNA-binding CsgD family transcriptional regulator
VDRPAASWHDDLRAMAHMPAWWACAAALALQQLGVTLLNNSVFPLFQDTLLEARDIGSLFTCALALALYLVAARHPAAMEPRRCTAVALACCAVGAPLTVVAAQQGWAAVLVAAVCLRGAGTLWTGLLPYTACVWIIGQQGTRPVLVGVCLGWAAGYLLELGVAALPQTIQLVLFCLLPFAVTALVYRPAAEVIGHTLEAEPVADLRVTNPRSFISLGSSVFVTLVLLKMSFGFAMTFNSVDATPQSTVLASMPALLIAGCLTLASRPGFGLNAYYKATMLCVLAGFLLANPLIADVTGMPALANVVLRAGSDLTRMFALLIAAYVGSRNLVNALDVALFVSAANSLGSVAGAQLGIWANGLLASDPGRLALLLAVVVFAFVAYNVLAPHSFDFDAAAHAVEPVVPAVPSQGPDAITVACAALARERGLTPREAEALELLAHGRNTAAIQERMVVSRSTAKTHVRNVYAKLDVHAQQDLIDLVEAGVRTTDDAR